ncbi:MAG: hypothetical protein V2B19_03855 [Pseudomonadota bacterium]
MKHSSLMTAGIPAVILASFFVLSVSGHLALRVPELVGYTALTTLLAVFAVYAAERGWCR